MMNQPELKRTNAEKTMKITLRVDGFSAEEAARSFLANILNEHARELLATSMLRRVDGAPNAYTSDWYVCCSGNKWYWCDPGNSICWPGGDGCPA